MKEYFSHDIDARNDKKIAKLMFKFNWQGYGIYWGIVEFLHNNGNTIDLDELPVLANNLNCEFETLKSIICDFELFFIEKNKIYSKRIAKNLKQQKEKSKKAKQSAMQRWQQKSDDANALQTHSERNANKVNKSKVKESKLNNKNIFTLGEFQNVLLSESELSKVKEIYSNTKQFDQAIEKLSSYIAGKGVKYKSHYAVLGKHNWVYKQIVGEKKEESDGYNY